MFDKITQEEFDSKIQQSIIELNKFEPSHWMEIASCNTDKIYLEMLKLKGINYLRQHRNEICFPETHIKKKYKHFDDLYTYSYKQLFDIFVR